eukprot:gene4863-34622_t
MVRLLASKLPPRAISLPSWLGGSTAAAASSSCRRVFMSIRDGPLGAPSVIRADDSLKDLVLELRHVASKGKAGAKRSTVKLPDAPKEEDWNEKPVRKLRILMKMKEAIKKKEEGLGAGGKRQEAGSESDTETGTGTGTNTMKEEEGLGSGGRARARNWDWDYPNGESIQAINRKEEGLGAGPGSETETGTGTATGTGTGTGTNPMGIEKKEEGGAEESADAPNKKQRGNKFKALQQAQLAQSFWAIDASWHCDQGLPSKRGFLKKRDNKKKGKVAVEESIGTTLDQSYAMRQKVCRIGSVTGSVTASVTGSEEKDTVGIDDSIGTTLDQSYTMRQKRKVGRIGSVTASVTGSEEKDTVGIDDSISTTLDQSYAMRQKVDQIVSVMVV